MNKLYFVKTRNWNCNKFVKKLLDLSLCFGVYRGDSYDDGDGKYCLDTENQFHAWLIWAYFMLLRRFSGGWTYIQRPGASFDSPCTYKAIY